MTREPFEEVPANKETLEERTKALCYESRGDELDRARYDDRHRVRGCYEEFKRGCDL
jgi:hypothetical protein